MSSFDAVGLGNPGSYYAGHRHNAGHQFLDWMAAQSGLKFTKKKYGWLCDDATAIYLKTDCYMNVSSKCYKQFLKYRRVGLADADQEPPSPAHRRLR